MWSYVLVSTLVFVEGLPLLFTGLPVPDTQPPISVTTVLDLRDGGRVLRVTAAAAWFAHQHWLRHCLTVVLLGLLAYTAASHRRADCWCVVVCAWTGMFCCLLLFFGMMGLI